MHGPWELDLNFGVIGGTSHWIYRIDKRCFLYLCLKFCRDGADLISDGIAFQDMVPAKVTLS